MKYLIFYMENQNLNYGENMLLILDLSQNPIMFQVKSTAMSQKILIIGYQKKEF